MSAKVTTAHPELHPGTHLSLDAYTSEKVNVGIGPGRIDGMHLAGINVARADLLAAISSELGVVIIDKADLPEVTVEPDGALKVDGKRYWVDDPQYSAERRKRILAYLAVERHAEAHPPVDEAQVKALAEIVRAATDTPADAYIGADLTAEGIARRLVATGKVEVRS